MNEEFKKCLENEEKVLYVSKAYVNKVAKQPLRMLLGILVLGIFWALILNVKKAEFDMEYLFIFSVLILLTVIFIYSAIYNICLKYKNKANEYLVTDKKVAVYNKKRGLVSRKISEIERIGITNEKGKYGNLIFNFTSDSLLESVKSSIAFEGVENPRNIIESIIIENNTISVYDDKPKIMGRKI